MERINNINIVIEKDSNKGNTKVGLTLGEYDENETISEFIERVKKYMTDMLVD